MSAAAVRIVKDQNKAKAQANAHSGGLHGDSGSFKDRHPSLYKVSPEDEKDSEMDSELNNTIGEVLAARRKAEQEEKEKRLERESSMANIPGFKFVDTGPWKYQRQAQEFYCRQDVEYFVAFLIVANFLTSVVEYTIDPCDPSNVYSRADCKKYPDTWDGFSTFYNLAFLAELIINMYGYWLCDFWKRGWNQFDFFVVMLGVLDMLKIDLGPLKLLRMARAFRVFRLFKRVKSLNKILVSLFKAVPGVLNAFLIMTIFMCIYAILGVEFYQYYGQDCDLVLGKRAANDTMGDDNGGDDCVYAGSGRSADTPFGVAYFGNFMKSLYSLFQARASTSLSRSTRRVPAARARARARRQGRAPTPTGPPRRRARSHPHRAGRAALPAPRPSSFSCRC
jgi:hypothetical protein